MGVRSKPVADDFQATAMSLWLVTINFNTHTLGFYRLPDVARLVAGLSNVDFAVKWPLGPSKALIADARERLRTPHPRTQVIVGVGPGPAW